jgi:uncharacterized protein (TIGR03066 family)
VLAYHYLTAGSKDAAVAQLQELNRQNPQDHLVQQMLLMTAGPEALGTPPTTPASSATAAAQPAPPTIDAGTLVGAWNADGPDGSRFALELTKEGNFSWTYTQKGKPQTIKGVYALDGDTLAMEPDSGGVMLAQISAPQAGSFQFSMLGAPPDDPGLKFTKGS